jgi:hypothetical protein
LRELIHPNLLGTRSAFTGYGMQHSAKRITWDGYVAIFI